MLPENSSRPLPAKTAHSHNLAHASLETAVCSSVRLWLYLESPSRSLSLFGHRIQGPRTNELMRIRRRTLRKDEVPPWRGR